MNDSPRQPKTTARCYRNGKRFFLGVIAAGAILAVVLNAFASPSQITRCTVSLLAALPVLDVIWREVIHG